MIIELILTSMFSLSGIGTSEFFTIEENTFEYVEHMSDEFKKTYRIENNRFISFFYSDSPSDEKQILRYQNDFGSGIVRILSSCDSIINTNERRIAFRVAKTQNQRYGNDYHFVWQCADGSWAEKLGFYGYCGNYPGEYAPENSNIWHSYNSPTLYFAFANGGNS